MTDDDLPAGKPAADPGDAPGSNGVLDWITIEGLRSIRSLQKFDIHPVNVLIGANGAGKSNFVEAFSLLHAMREGRLQHHVHRFGGADRLLHHGVETTTEITLHLSFSEERTQYRVVLEASGADAIRVASEVVLSRDEENHEQRLPRPLPSDGNEAAISMFDLRGAPSRVRRHLDGWRVYHFHNTSVFAPLRKTANVHDRHVLQADGSNLPAFLLALRETYPTAYFLIRDTVRLAMPFLDDFVLQPFGEHDDAVRLQWTHRNSNKPFDAVSLSDGALRFIALTTLFLQPSKLRPRVILLDEPELGLHPYALNLLAAMVRSGSVASQIVLSTQSAILLDYFEPEEVIVSERENGETRMRRLESDTLAVWLEDESLGQLWEKNYIGGRPKSDHLPREREGRSGASSEAQRNGRDPLSFCAVHSPKNPSKYGDGNVSTR